MGGKGLGVADDGKPKLQKFTCYVDPALHKAMRVEAVERDMTLGEIVQEAYRTRVVQLKPEPKRTPARVRA